jgi:peptidoglycan-N-acetylglucosamine deacetylase
MLSYTDWCDASALSTYCLGLGMTLKPGTKIIVIISGLILCLFVQIVFAQEIAFAFDKTLAGSAGLDGTARSKMLVRNLQKAGVFQSMFFVRTKDINDKTIERVMFYDDQGQLIVNVGARYSFLSRPNIDRFEADIVKADAELSQYLHYEKHIYFPYLYEGGDAVLVDKLRLFLTEQGYRPTYVSYRAHDDYMDFLYRRRVADNKAVDMGLLEKAYVNMLMADITAYDAKAYVFLGYHPKQVILLHENDVTAYSILSLVDALNEKGFKVVTPGKIFSDPVVNPFYADGYSAVGYMRSVTGFSNSRRDDLHVLTDVEKQAVHAFLSEQGLGYLTVQ